MNKNSWVYGGGKGIFEEGKKKGTNSDHQKFQHKKKGVGL